MINDHLINIEKSIAAIRAELNNIPATNNETYVKTQADLQAAVNALNNTTIKVKPGIYDLLAIKGANKNLKIVPDTVLPEGRAQNDWAESLIQIKTFKVENDASQYYLRGFKFLPGAVENAIVSLGSDVATDPTQVPNDINFDQCICNADPVKGGKRGFALNCRKVSIYNSRAENFFYTSDSQAVMGWNGPGPFDLYNNYFTASGENVMFGGGDAMNESMCPRDLTFIGNHCTKVPEWRTNVQAKVKNIFELKNMIGFNIQANLFEHSWKSAQVGYAIMITPRNQGGNSPFTQVADGKFLWNVVRHAAGGINILGDDNVASSRITENILIANNLFYDIGLLYDPTGAGKMITIDRGPKNIEFRLNTMLFNKGYSFLDLANTSPQLIFKDNVVSEGSYGIHTPDGDGSMGFDKHVLNGMFDGNVIVTPFAPSTRKTTYSVSNVKNTMIVGEANDFASPEPLKGCDIKQLRQRVVF